MNSTQTLADLIKSVQELNDWSDRDLGRRAEKLGLDITTSNFSRLKNRELVSVKGSLIRMLAQVLKVPEPKVAHAAMASMGVELEASDSTVDEAVRNSSELSVRDQELVIALVSAMRNSGSDSHDQEPDSHSPNAHPTLRAVAPTSDTSQGQKTGPDDSIIEFHGAEAEKYPAPPIESLAAHPKVKTRREQLDELTGERDADNQDPGNNS